jgi:hypothetical protein
MNLVETHRPRRWSLDAVRGRALESRPERLISIRANVISESIQDLEHRRERQLTLREPEARTAGEDPSRERVVNPRLGVFDELRDEARLADSRFSGDEDDGSLTVVHRHGPDEVRELALSPDQSRTRRSPAHAGHRTTAHEMIEGEAVGASGSANPRVVAERALDE